MHTFDLCLMSCCWTFWISWTHVGLVNMVFFFYPPAHGRWNLLCSIMLFVWRHIVLWIKMVNMPWFILETARNNSRTTHTSQPSITFFLVSLSGFQSFSFLLFLPHFHLSVLKPFFSSLSGGGTPPGTTGARAPQASLKPRHSLQTLCLKPDWFFILVLFK